MEPNSAL